MPALTRKTYSTRTYFFAAVFVAAFGIFFIGNSAHAAVDWSECRTESGTTMISAGSRSKTVSLDTTLSSTANAFLLFDTSGTSHIRNGQDGTATGHIANTRSIQFDRYGTKGNAQISYSVVECPNAAFSVQHGSITVPARSSRRTASISAVRTGQSMVIVNARAQDKTASRDTAAFTGHLTNASTVQVRRARNSNVAATIRYQVIEFDSAVSVQTAENTFRKGTSTTGSISAVDTDSSWVYCSHDASQDGLRQTAIGCHLNSSTTVELSRYSSGNYVNRIRYYVVEFPTDIQVQRGAIQANKPGTLPNEQYSQHILLSELSSVDKAFPYLTTTVAGAGVAFPRNQWLASITATNNLQTSFWMGAGKKIPANNNKYWQVVEFPHIPAPSIQSVAGSATNPTLTSTAFAGTVPHSESSWKVVKTADCESGTAVWRALNTTKHLESITVDATDGTFVGDLKNETELDSAVAYYACVSHTGSNGDSGWSQAYKIGDNILPAATNVSIDGGASTIIPTPGETTDVTITATVTDADGCDDISSVEAVFYRSGVGADAPDDDKNHYTAGCSAVANSCSGADDTEAEYSCVVPSAYFVQPTDSSSSHPSEYWQATVTASDQVGSGTASTDTIEMSSVVSVKLLGTIDYGDLGLGQDTAEANQQVLVENAGNYPIDFEVSTYGVTPGDGYAFVCDSGSIPAENLKYSVGEFTYQHGGEQLNHEPKHVQVGLDPSEGLPRIYTLYFGLRIPTSGVGGACSGFLSISAVPSAI